MGKRDLKKQYPNLQYDFVDLLSKLDKTKTNKLTPFIIKQFNEWIKFDSKIDCQSVPVGHSEMVKLFGPSKNEIDDIINMLIYNWFQPKKDILDSFVNHLENNRLSNPDINSYDNWNAMSLAVDEADFRNEIKNSRNKVIRLLDNEEWLILKPLSMESSINYGYGTTWCTSMKNESDYFHRYSSEGILIYVINKKTGVKYGFYNKESEGISVWSMDDKRIDTLSTTIPNEILIELKGWLDLSNGVNYDYFEEEDKSVYPNKKGYNEAIYIAPESPGVEERNIWDLDDIG